MVAARAAVKSKTASEEQADAVRRCAVDEIRRGSPTRFGAIAVFSLTSGETFQVGQDTCSCIGAA
jgi:hypothetical protein